MYNGVSERRIKMFSMIFNATNLVWLILAAIICYTLWEPFIRGKKIEAVVDGYCHPTEGKYKDDLWRYRFMYREVKAGKRLYCYSNKNYETKEEMRKYPKGAQVMIRYYQPSKDETKAVIISDNEDLKRTILYTVATVVGMIALGVGYQILCIQLGR
jgi:hypothetical protein